MAYNQDLAKRVEEILFIKKSPNLNPKKMFGGVGFMVSGNMVCGVNKDNLIVRVGKDAYESNLQIPGTKVFDITGRPMKGWVSISSEFLQSDDDLSDWIQKGLDFTLTLPAK